MIIAGTRRPVARSTFAAALVSLVLAATVIARPARAADCVEAISAENARKLFEELRDAKSGDGCELSGVSTDASQMVIVWAKGGQVQEPVLVAPTSCVQAPTTRGLVLSTVVQPSTAGACPASVQKLAALVTGETFGGLVAVGKPVSMPVVAPAVQGRPLMDRLRPAGIWALVAASAGAAFVALRRHMTGRRVARAAAAPGTGARVGLLERAASAAWARIRAALRVHPRSASRAGWGAAILLAPHLLLGTWLVVVPDHLAFTTAQVVTLAHVGLALLTFPLVGGWILWHVLGRRGPQGRGPFRVRAVRWALAAATVVAAVTGIMAMQAGNIAPTAALHAACGVAVGAPLALHLWLGSQRAAAVAALGVLVVATMGGAAARALLPPASAEAEVPAFAYATHAERLYEPAENCGECHVQDYEDWKRSTHARTLQLASVREAMGRQPNLLHEDLGHIGQLIRDRERPLDAALVFGACGACHAPTSFYGDGKPSLLEPEGLTAEGTGCSFCHTLRQVRRDTDPLRLEPDEHGALRNVDIFTAMSRAPLFVSAPETVRRYLGQGSRNPLARRISNWLIRWRPEVHARDYHSPVLDDSRACLPCHSLGLDRPDVPHMTYFAWEKSSFATGDPKTTVECQDCHMARHMTGAQVNEEAREVPWGPTRPHARSHLFLGGNVRASKTFGDPDLARQQHELNVGAVTVEISRASRAQDAVDVTVTVRSQRVGHHFPAIETKMRYAWVELKALDAAGHVVGQTPRPKDSDDFGCASPLIMASNDDVKPDTQRVVPARSSREFEAHVAVPVGVDVDHIVAELHESVDEEPLATAARSLHEAM